MQQHHKPLHPILPVLLILEKRYENLSLLLPIAISLYSTFEVLFRHVLFKYQFIAIRIGVVIIQAVVRLASEERDSASMCSDRSSASTEKSCLEGSATNRPCIAPKGENWLHCFFMFSFRMSVRESSSNASFSYWKLFDTCLCNSNTVFVFR